MAIEVRQLLVKSNVAQRAPATSGGGDDLPQDLPQQLEDLGESILAECKKMIIDVLREQQER